MDESSSSSHSSSTSSSSTSSSSGVADGMKQRRSGLKDCMCEAYA